MALILAIEPDKKQASAVRALARGSLHAQMLIADSTARGLQELDGRIPNLILTSLLLSAKDLAALDEHLRGLDTEGHHVPTLVIPVLAAVSRGSKGAGLLKRLKKPRKTTGTEACDPATFAAQITEYLDRAAAERELEEDEDDDELPIAARPRAPLPVDTASPNVATQVSTGAVGRILFASPDVTSIDVDRSTAVVRPMNVAASVDPAFDVRGLAAERADADVTRDAVDDTPTAPDVADDVAAWAAIPLEATDASLEITAEPIDLNAFVEELEAVVSSYQPGARGLGAGRYENASRFEARELEDAIVLEIDPLVEAADFGLVGQAEATPAFLDVAGLGTLTPKPTATPADPPAGLATRYAWPALEGVPAGTDWETTKPGDPDYEILADFVEAFETPPTVPAPSAADPMFEEIVSVDAKSVSSPTAVDRDSWVSLSMSRYNWPPLQGVECLDALAVIEWDDADVLAAEAILPVEPPPTRVVRNAARPAAATVHGAIAEIVVPVPAPPRPAPPAAQWLEILAAIRRDIQELRAEHRAGMLAEGDVSTPPNSVTARLAADTVQAGAAIDAARAIALGSPAERPRAKKLHTVPAPAAPERKRKRKMPPKQDEWGFFDPNQCGFAALLAKLEEIEGDEPAPTTPSGSEQS